MINLFLTYSLKKIVIGLNYQNTEEKKIKMAIILDRLPLLVQQTGP